MTDSLEVGALIQATSAEIAVELHQDPATVLKVNRYPSLELRGLVGIDRNVPIWMPYPVDADRLAKGDVEAVAREFVADLKTVRRTTPHGGIAAAT